MDGLMIDETVRHGLQQQQKQSGKEMLAKTPRKGLGLMINETKTPNSRAIPSSATRKTSRAPTFEVFEDTEEVAIQEEKSAERLCSSPIEGVSRLPSRPQSPLFGLEEGLAEEGDVILVDENEDDVGALGDYNNISIDIEVVELGIEKWEKYPPIDTVSLMDDGLEDFRKDYVVSNNTCMIHVFGNNEDFLLESFDIILREYVDIPQITARLKIDQCLSVENIKIFPNQSFVTKNIPSDIWAHCQNSRRTIYRLELVDKQENEFLIFEHNIEVHEDSNFKLYYLDNRDIPIMSKKKWMYMAAFNTTGLYFDFDDHHSIYTRFIKIHRVKMEQNCPYVFYEKDIDSRIEDQRGVAETSELDLAYIRLNDTGELKQNTFLRFDWKFVLNCGCEKQHLFIENNSSLNFLSLNYPEVYCKNMNCQYHFSTNENSILEVYINDVRLDDIGDHLSIYDGNYIDFNYLLAYIVGNNSKSSRSFKASRNLTLLFESNNILTKFEKGFNITIQSKIEPRKVEQIAEQIIQYEEPPTSHKFLVLLMIVLIVLIFVGGIILLVKMGMFDEIPFFKK
ncbi:unnamed protein product [Caenorhabditis angaria]|uniref:CUB domain-containing protein n=1 Tax=Caenorhabditis angaria TaxID=860376 RepID=A0A9P1I3U3_9PELO|nr:unnamed protein product [Caenorhabditis angaria]